MLRRHTSRHRRRHARREGRWRKRWQVDWFFHEAIVVNWKVLVAVCIDECKGCTTRTVHGCLLGLSSSPSEVYTADTRRENKWFLGRHSNQPTKIGRIQHSMSLCVSYKSFHCCIVPLSAILLDRIRLGRFLFGFLGVTAGVVVAVAGVSFLPTHSSLRL